jgi:hypothetical protein
MLGYGHSIVNHATTMIGRGFSSTSLVSRFGTVLAK